MAETIYEGKLWLILKDKNDKKLVFKTLEKQEKLNQK